MTGSSYLPIVLPIIAFFAMAFWLGLIFYADSHPGYKHRKVQPVDDRTKPDVRPGLEGTVVPGQPEPVAGHSPGPLAA